MSARYEVLTGDEARAAVLASRLAVWESRLDYWRSVKNAARVAECESALAHLRGESSC